MLGVLLEAASMFSGRCLNGIGTRMTGGRTRETALSFGPSIAGGDRRVVGGDCGRDDMVAQFVITSIDDIW